MLQIGKKSTKKVTEVVCRQYSLKTHVKQQEVQKDKHLPEYKKRDRAIKQRYGTWNPTRKLSRQQINDIRLMGNMKTIEIANMYRISPEAIRRILKSKWVPGDAEEDKKVRH